MKECIAMLLAGGQGSRLYALTQTIAKPAVYFGGKYRIIDFPLSNCINSGIDTVGVLTQYQPLELNEYLGNGQPWDLDRNYGGVHVLPPYQKASKSDWYTGTANAIYQNIQFIKRYNPEYVLILSGDHIYKMDYDTMLTHHKQTNADCTIAVLNVSKEEASRFGIMTCDENGKIVKFTEKPKEPESTLASMGIYIFTWEKLQKYLTQDEDNETSDKDFGKNIIPDMLKDGQNMQAYEFDGYWKDVGTIESLWEANMDLLNPNVPFDVWDNAWKIYSRNRNMPPHYIAENSTVKHAIVGGGGVIKGDIDFSVVFPNVTLEEGAIVEDSIIMPNVKIGKNSIVRYAIISENCVIGDNVVIGARPEDVEDVSSWGITVLGNDVVIKDGEEIKTKSMIYSDGRRE